jgi:hypothetical protein
MKTTLFLLLGFGIHGAMAQGALTTLTADSLDTDGTMVEEIAPDRPAGRPDTVRWGDAVPVYPYTVTISPVHLLGFLSLEGSIERALTPHFGVTLFGGVGTIPSLFGARRGPGLDLQEIGTQLRWYPRSPQRWNTHFGLEGFWGRADYRQDMTDDDGSWLALDFTNVWTAWGGGPFVGTKFINHDHYVVEIQAGYQGGYVTDRDGDRKFMTFPILNLNIGRAF